MLVPILIGLGALVSVVAAVMLAVELPERAEMWAWPLQALGQLGLIVALAVAAVRIDAADASGWAGLTVSEARLAIAGVLGFEAALIGATATARRRWDWAWVSMGFAAGAIGMLLARIDPSAGQLVGFLIPAGMLVATVAALADSIELRERAAMWVGPAQGLGQFGLLVVALAALLRLQDSTVSAWEGLGTGDAQLALSAVLAFEAVLVGAVGTRREQPAAPWIAVVSAGGAYAMFGAWAGWGPVGIWAATIPPGVVLALAAVLAAVRRVGGRAGMWTAPVHVLGQVGLVVGGLVALANFGVQAAAGNWAALLGGEAVLLGMAAPLVPAELRPRDTAAGLAMAAVLCAVGAVEGATGQTVVLQVVAGLGAVSLFSVDALRRRYPEWHTGGWVFGLGAIAGAMILAAALIDPVGGAMAGTLAIGGAGLVAGGLRSGRWPLAYLGLVMILGAALMAGREVLDGNRHAYAVSIAVVLLIILDMERIRLGRVDHPARRERLDVIRVAELVVMGVPLLMAGIDALRDFPYTGLLAGESVMILLWAIASQVRRRLLVGALGVVATILIPAVMLARSAGSGGITIRKALAIGAALAVVFIVVGSLLERGRARVGRAIRRVSEILEEWE